MTATSDLAPRRLRDIFGTFATGGRYAGLAPVERLLEAAG